MKDTLMFVRGAVAQKDLVPVLTHFHFYDGRVQGGNGRLAIDAPLPELRGVDVTVPAKRFLSAVDACDGEPTMNVTDAGRLSLRRNRFRALLPLAEHESYPRAVPEGERYDVDAGLVDALRRLVPFVSEDASRPWSRGVLLRDGYAYATNNVVIARVPCTWDAPAVNLPAEAIAELVRVKRALQYVQQTDKSVTFHYDGGAWMRSALYDLAWPSVDQFFAPDEGAVLRDVPDGVAAGVESLLPFVEDAAFPRIVVEPGALRAEDAELEIATGAAPDAAAAFHAKPLLSALREAQRWDTSRTPIPWEGAGGMQGAMMPLRE
jgi:hypothetical protein